MMHYRQEITFGTRNAGTNAQGMRPMQERVFANRKQQFLLVKAPPASGKSRALMYVALDKMRHQGLKKTIITVPETSIGASFKATDLTSAGFEADWTIKDENNLCLTGDEAQTHKTQAFRRFLASDDKVLLCTHATFRNATHKVLLEEGVTAFDNCFIGMDEFHHWSSSEKSRLGEILRSLLKRKKAHILAMTGSYFRGDREPILTPEEEVDFTIVTYSYYDQLESYKYLKTLNIDYEFYTGNYLNGLKDILDTHVKTIIHIPSRNSSAMVADKRDEVGMIKDIIGEDLGEDPKTCFDHIKTKDGRVLKVVNLVDDGPKREIRKSALNHVGKDDVDIIIALGMAKEGFDWIWCEQAITCGLRRSFTELVQIIGRTTRDAPGKTRALFANLVAHPGVESNDITEMVNDYLKAIAGSLLMEQVLVPKFEFYRPKDDAIRPEIKEDSLGNVQIALPGLKECPTERSKEACKDLSPLMERICQCAQAKDVKPGRDPSSLHLGLIPKVARELYPDYSDEEIEAISDHGSAQLILPHLARKQAFEEQQKAAITERKTDDADVKRWKREIGVNKKQDEKKDASKPMMELLSKINVRKLDMDLIKKTNPFADRFEVLSKDMDGKTFREVHNGLIHMRVRMTEEDACDNWPRIRQFINEHHGKRPDPNSTDQDEKEMGEALAWLQREYAIRLRDKKRKSS